MVVRLSIWALGALRCRMSKWRGLNFCQKVLLVRSFLIVEVRYFLIVIADLNNPLFDHYFFWFLDTFLVRLKSTYINRIFLFERNRPSDGFWCLHVSLIDTKVFLSSQTWFFDSKSHIPMELPLLLTFLKQFIYWISLFPVFSFLLVMI